MDLNLFSLRVFLKVAEKQSFTKAAAELLLSQPAISSQIRKLEDYFHAPLVFRKHSGRIILTEAGETLRRTAETILKQQEELLNEMEKHTGGTLKELCIGACCIAGEHLLPLGLETFREKYPRYDTNLNITKCKNVFDGLLSGNFDVGITGISSRNKFIEEKKLFEVPLVLFEARQNRSYPRSISVRALLELKVILREEGAGCRVELQKFLSKNGVKFKDLNIVSVSESNEAIKELVKRIGGVSVLPSFMIEKEIKNEIFGEILLREGKMIQTFYITYRKQEILNRNLQDFVEFIVRYKPHHLSDSFIPTP